jgi:hypothetical protein
MPLVISAARKWPESIVSHKVKISPALVQASLYRAIDKVGKAQSYDANNGTESSDGRQLRLGPSVFQISLQERSTPIKEASSFGREAIECLVREIAAKVLKQRLHST